MIMLLLRCHKALRKLQIDNLTDRACEQSRKRSGVVRKSGEWEGSGEQTFQKTLERQRRVEREATKRRRAGVTKKIECSAANRPLYHNPLTASYEHHSSKLDLRSVMFAARRP